MTQRYAPVSVGERAESGILASFRVSFLGIPWFAIGGSTAGDETHREDDG